MEIQITHCPIIVEYRHHYCFLFPFFILYARLSSLTHASETVWWDEAKPEKKTHCRINGIKGGVVMNTNACTANVIVSLSHICTRYNHIYIPCGWMCPSWAHPNPHPHTLLSLCWFCCSRSISSAHILSLLMNAWPFSIFGWPKKKNATVQNELNSPRCYFSFGQIFSSHSAMHASPFHCLKAIHSSLR